jgi:ATP-dependent Lhr-like helicase
LVTNDALDAARGAGAFDKTPGQKSELEAELAVRLARVPRTLSHTRYRDAKRRVAKRLRAETPTTTQIQGRWSLVHRAAVLGQMSDEERAEKLARVYLARYGIVTRECLEREDRASDWAMLYPIFNRWEMRGEIRRGYFVEGLSGVQFAAKDAVEMLRAASADALIVINAADPANIADVARVASTHVVLSRGEPIVIAEDNGERIVARGEEGALKRALQTYVARAPRRIVVKTWNGASVRGSAGETILQSLGFYRAPTGMER